MIMIFFLKKKSKLKTTFNQPHVNIVCTSLCSSLSATLTVLTVSDFTQILSCCQWRCRRGSRNKLPRTISALRRRNRKWLRWDQWLKRMFSLQLFTSKLSQRRRTSATLSQMGRSPKPPNQPTTSLTTWRSMAMASRGWAGYKVRAALRAAVRTIRAAQRTLRLHYQARPSWPRHQSKPLSARSPFRGNHTRNFTTAGSLIQRTAAPTRCCHQPKAPCKAWRGPCWIVSSTWRACRSRWPNPRNPSCARIAARPSTGTATWRDICASTPERSRTAATSAAGVSIRRAASRATWRLTGLVRANLPAAELNDCERASWIKKGNLVSENQDHLLYLDILEFNNLPKVVKTPNRTAGRILTHQDFKSLIAACTVNLLYIEFSLFYFTI